MATEQRKTSQMTASSAQICHDMGWAAGTILAEPGGPHVIQITAVGIEHVLARQAVVIDLPRLMFGEESIWQLNQRNWEAV